MIGVPTNFRHTAHISSGDIDMSIAQLADLQAQMQRKSGFDNDFGAKVRQETSSLRVPQALLFFFDSFFLERPSFMYEIVRCTEKCI